MAREAKERPSGCGCSGDRLSGQRRRIVPEARGTVVEIGIGSGENLPFYDAGRVHRLIGVDPSRAAPRKVTRRATRLGFAVDTLRAAAEALARMDDAGDLSRAFGAPKTATPDLIEQVEREEGWILGA